MTLWYSISLWRRKYDVADIAWGGAFLVVALTVLAFQDTITSRAVLVTTLVAIWGIRLSGHLLVRNWSKPEDVRYRNWRREWGNHADLRAFFQVFMLQGLLALVISIPVVAAIDGRNGPLNILDLAGAAIWLFGFVFETVGDHQLTRFKSDPANKGRIIQTGLWKYTRHPNYFGEVALWWGIYLISLNVPRGWLTIIGPALISFLILNVSGIPLLEKHYAGREDYEEYKRRTSAFFPLPPRKKER